MQAIHYTLESGIFFSSFHSLRFLFPLSPYISIHTRENGAPALRTGRTGRGQVQKELHLQVLAHLSGSPKTTRPIYTAG